jgi:hypothetical protein
MKQVINNRLRKQLHNILVPSYGKGKKHSIITPASALLFIIAIFTILTGLVLAQELPYPNPIYPPNGGTIDIDKITSIVFSWTRFYVGTNKYNFELAKNEDMSNLVVKATISDGLTTYKYTGKLDYNTTYYWRVMASEPLGGEWGSAIFTTKAIQASTNNVTKPKESTPESFPSSIINYLTNKDNLPIVGLIAGVVIIGIIALVVLAKPKSKPAGQRQWQGMPPPQMQQPIVCPACGLPNSPERKFCSNCGTGLTSRGPQQPPWGTQPTTACPNCGLPNSPERKFCSNCGTGLASRGPQQPWGTQQPNTCLSCGLPNPPGQRFCYNCGTNLAGGQQPPPPLQQQQQQQWQVYQTFTCPICGTPVNKGSNPCPNCRTWLDWGA